MIILGGANLVADGFSMAASNFLGSRAERQQRDRARREEQLHIRLVPEGEREEIRQIYAAKGFEGEDLERVVEVITSDRELWAETMMSEELGFASTEPNEYRAALSPSPRSSPSASCRCWCTSTTSPHPATSPSRSPGAR